MAAYIIGMQTRREAVFRPVLACSVRELFHEPLAVSIADARLFIRLGVVRPKSRCLRALGVGEDGIERLAGRHKETVLFCAAKAQIGAGLRQMDFSDDFAIGRETVNAIEIFRAPARSGPEIAVGVAPNAVG